MPQDPYKKNLVSTIIPVHNRPKLVGEAVASVLAQSYEEIEIIVVDDGSTDPAMEDALADCCRLGPGKVQIIKQENLGPGAARQRGFECANGEFVQFLDSDDLLLKDKFRLQVDALTSFPSAGASYGRTRYVSASGEVIAPWRKTGEEIHYMFPAMLAERFWGTSTPLYRSWILREVGPIAKLSNEEDWEYDCRIAARGVQLAWVDEWVSEQRAVAANRASSGGSTEPAKLRDRAKARQLILESAMSARVPIDAPEFQHFIRYSFLVARQCALAGLPDEAEKLVRLLQDVQPRPLMSAYILAGRVFGLRGVTGMAEVLHGLQRRVRKASKL